MKTFKKYAILVLLINFTFSNLAYASDISSIDDGEVLAVPQYQNKTLKGYQLQELADQSVMKQMGLKKGDVLIEGQEGELTFLRKGKKMKIQNSNDKLVVESSN